jgi:hypothetical protein
MVPVIPKSKIPMSKNSEIAAFKTSNTYRPNRPESRHLDFQNLEFCDLDLSFDFAQDGESFDSAQDRERVERPVEPLGIWVLGFWNS